MPSDWSVVKAKLAAALELPPDKRAEFLDRECAGDAPLRAEIESLLAAHDNAGEFLHTVTSPHIASLTQIAGESLGPGDRLGIYTIVQKIDEGGMAAVYQAVRDDSEFRKLVAIKILKSGMDTAFILDRFQKEKQILAHFDHPNIAKLLDGGTTPSGRPYFVLEFIAGLPIDVYCQQRELSIEGRLRLIQKVCGAVEYAHQNLIVHRDLKPRNILVTDDGTPKLLDFGIAKILDDERELTITGIRLMTPEYASPEQIRGEPISTVTDIYCLGLILYELLTGSRPFRAPTGSQHELARVILESNAKRPSTVVREAGKKADAAKLRGDLDNIVLKAMHIEPHRRYRSIGEFSTDIDRYFAGLPLHATGDEMSYRVGKFVKRHRTAVFASVAVLLSLTSGLLVAAHQAGVARGERQVSEQRAAEIRRLANSLIFDLHDAIKPLPGSTPVRAVLIDRAASALDGLSTSNTHDPAIQKELASAYQRLAEVQGAPNAANLGNLNASFASYQKAKAIFLQLHKTLPDDPAIMRSLASVNWDMYSILLRQGNKTEARPLGLEATQLNVDASKVAKGGDSLRDLATAYYMRGNLDVDAGDLESARVSRNKSYELWETVAKNDPSDDRALYQVALAAKNLGAVEQRFNNLALAAKVTERAREIDARRAEQNPQDDKIQLDLSFDLSELAELSIRSNDLNKAADYYRQARSIREQLLAKDPANHRLKDRTAFILSREARVQLQLGRAAAAAVPFQKAYDLRRELAEEKTDLHAQFAVAESLGDLGWLHCEQGNKAQGRGELRRSISSIEELIGRNAVTIEDRDALPEFTSRLKKCGA